jgi:chromosome segregation ATPase
MALLNFRQKQDQLERLESDLAKAMEAANQAEKENKPQRTLLEANIANVDRLVTRFVMDATELEAQLAEREERLRQVKISIEAFTLALERMRS